MDWPVLVDSFNRFDVKVVPITLLVDERGVIRAVNPRPADLDAFLAADPVDVETDGAAPNPVVTRPDLEADRAIDPAAPAVDRRRAADRLATWGEGLDRDRAIALYAQLAAEDPSDGRARFREGVARLRRSESPSARPDDFAAAIAAFRSGLAIDPNQYIWRRRIQQYGPRIDKPYPFYDWVDDARGRIVARGETPHPLRVEPRGAEIARPQRGESGPAEAPTIEDPDPGGAVIRDDGLIRASAVVVGDTRRGTRARVFLTLTPDRNRQAWWNNEVEPVLLLVRDPAGPRGVRHAVAERIDAETQEPRVFEFEVAVTDEPLRVSAFYYVCEGRDGTCVYRRLDLSLTLDAPDGGLAVPAPAFPGVPRP